MPGSIRKYNNAGTQMVMQLTRRRDGRLSQHVYVGLYGQKGIRDVLRTNIATFRSSR